MMERTPRAGWLREWDNSKCCSADEDAGEGLFLLGYL